MANIEVLVSNKDDPEEKTKLFSDAQVGWIKLCITRLFLITRLPTTAMENYNYSFVRCLVNNVSVCFCRYIGALGARVICDNIPGLVNKQRQLCQRHPDLMQSIGEGAKEWIRECQHQFRHHRWNCSTLERDRTVFGRVMLRSQYLCYTSSSS